MAETADDLSAPLGQQAPRKRRWKLPFGAPQLIAVLLGLFLTVFLLFVIFGNDPFGGEPVARVALSQKGPADSKMAMVPADAPAKSTDKSPNKAAVNHSPANPGQKTVNIIDGSSGTKQSVVLSGEASDDDAPDAAPAVVAGINPRLLEKSRYGMVPIAADGLKPFTAYAAGSDAERAKAATMPTVSIVIGGLGIGAAKTTDAIMKLPSAVTLAFTPYGADPGKFIERARAQKHEVLLQVPMEPFDYPDNDPGPQTLLTTLSPEQNLDRLMWHLSRFQGYVGLASFMGSKFVVTDAAMQPILRDAAKRGLGYLDDGSAPRSTAGPIAEGQAMPFAKADVTIDSVPTPAEIDRALAKLETLAKEHGSAIGVASALPVSIERIGIWSKALAARGIMLVPLTTTMLKSKSG